MAVSPRRHGQERSRLSASGESLLKRTSAMVTEANNNGIGLATSTYTTTISLSGAVSLCA